MPRSTAIVATVTRIDPPLQAPTAHFLANRAAAPIDVHFDGGQTALLESADPRAAHFADVLDEARRMTIPVYVDVDPVARTINQLMIPLVVGVAAVAPERAGEVQVELEISHGRHVIRSTNPDYGQLVREVEAARASGALVYVTETDDHEIIDVRPAPTPPTARATSVGPAGPTGPVTFGLAPVSPQRAQQLFDVANAQSCNPVQVPAPCIPFLYPDDGCWGRAHEMSRLMIAAGTTPGKVWIYGNLRVNTRNNPSCRVAWNWHVAPVLDVTTAAGTQQQVLDPSLFGGPVATAAWKSLQGDPAATLVVTDASAFYRSASGAIQTDPTYSQTAQVLATYRLQLKNRSATTGPPPYANCPLV